MALLSDLQEGQKAKITGYVKHNPKTLQRLLEMGLTKGKDVKAIKKAPLGDPIEISIRGYQLSLRLSEAELVEVEVN